MYSFIPKTCIIQCIQNLMKILNLWIGKIDIDISESQGNQDNERERLAAYLKEVSDALKITVPIIVGLIGLLLAALATFLFKRNRIGPYTVTSYCR